MAKRQLMSVLIGLKRDGKDWSPKPGEVHDFTQEEITAIEEANPSALRLPPDDSKDKTMRATPLGKDTPPAKLVGDQPDQQVKPPPGGMKVADKPLTGGKTADNKPKVEDGPHADNDL